MKKMEMLRRSLFTILLAVCLVLELTNTAAAKGVRLNKTKLSVMEGKTVTLKLKGKHGRAVWKSSNRSVASVIGNGRIKAKKKGKTVVSCNVDGKMLRCRVTVKKDATVAPVYSYDGEDEEDSDEVEETPVPTSTPMAMTEEEVYQKLLSLKTKYPEGMDWGFEKVYYGKTGEVSGKACAAFAQYIRDDVFGYGGVKMLNYDPALLRVGDELAMYDRAHTVVVLQVNDDSVTVVEGSYGGKVHWGRVIPFSSLDPSQTYILTRYPQ